MSISACAPYRGDAVWFPPSDIAACFLPHRFFSAVSSQAWAGRSWHVPGGALLAYTLLLLWPSPTRPRIGKVPVFCWNVLLALFSAAGTVVTLSALGTKVYRDGIVASACDDATWFGTDAMGIALVAFVFSKPVELVDTLLLKLRARPVIFLHWYHHISVMFYTWHAFVTRTSLGPWFASVNYSVHAIMYAYYALTQVGALRHRLKRVAPLITLIQISQMFVGMSLAAVAMGTPDCNDSPANTRLALGMYLSYAALFIAFFRRRQERPRVTSVHPKEA